MYRFLDWLLIFLPYQRSILHIPLPTPTVQQILDRVSATKLTVKPTSRWQRSYHYTFQRRGELLKIKGPFGYRRWCLVAEGVLQPSSEGTSLHLRLRFAAGRLFPAIFILVFYVAGAFWIFGRDIQIMLVPITFQLVFMYTILLGIFQYEASKLLTQLKQLFIEQ